MADTRNEWVIALGAAREKFDLPADAAQCNGKEPAGAGVLSFPVKLPVKKAKAWGAASKLT
jgi:hypothetical protein